MSVALKATPAEIEATATTFCRGATGSASLSALDRRGGGGRVRGPRARRHTRRVAPRFELSNWSMVLVDFAVTTPPLAEVATGDGARGLGRLVASLAAHDHALAPRLWVLGSPSASPERCQNRVDPQLAHTAPPSSLVLFASRHGLPAAAGPHDATAGHHGFWRRPVCSPYARADHWRERPRVCAS